MMLNKVVGAVVYGILLALVAMVYAVAVVCEFFLKLKKIIW